MNSRYLVAFACAFILSVSTALAYEVSFFSDKYVYAENESIYTKGIVKLNNTAISNVSIVFQAKDTTGSVVNSSTLTSNSSGYFNYTFSIAAVGNFTLQANVSGDFVQHFIKVKSYARVLTATDKPTYTASANGTLAVKVIDAAGNGVSSQVVGNNLRHASNGTLISSLSSCTTNTLGECSINFTSPAVDGQYMIDSNNFEGIVFFGVGGFDAVMKVTPSVLGLNSEVTVRVTVKNANGNTIAASTRQLVITFPNNTEYTVTSMTQAVDSSGSTLTGVYEDRYNATGEGTYKVKATIVAQGSNVTRELTGNFEVRGYTMDIVPWTGQSVFYPSSSVALGVKLRNASNNEFISGKTSSILTGASVLDPSNRPVVVNISVSEFAVLSSYRVDFVMPAASSPGTYKLKVALNDTVGTGSGTGYFTIQLVKASAVALDKFPNGTSKTNYLAGQPIVVKFTAQNGSGTVSVTGITSYIVKDEDGNDKTALFGTIANYTSGGSGYLNMTAPKNGGDYRVRARLTTAAGTADAEGSIFIDVLDISAVPVGIGGGLGSGFSPFGGPGFMFSFRPNDTIQLNVTVKSASEKQEGEGFMGHFDKGGSGPSIGGGLFGIGGGTVIQGAQVKVFRVININTDEDVTNTVTGTLNCVTDSSGRCTVKLTPTTNGNNWTGGFYIVFMNATTSDNQTDSDEAFFEVRRYFVEVRVTAAVQDNATSLGFQNFQSWNIGPNDNVIVNVTIREPGTWNNIPNTFNVTVLGFFYGGKIGDFIFPPKLITGTNATYNTSSANGTTVNAPSGGWKSGFYQVKVSVNSGGQIDTGEGFIMSRIYEGFGFPVNPTTLQQDFTARSRENITLRVSVYDVQRHAPAANLTVTKNKILSFSSFPPSELSYDQNVTQGTTDANGAVLMTLPAPAGGWPKGHFLAVFDVTNGSVSDNVEGFFQIRNFFAELTTSKWSFATNESIAYNVTISSDPSWMRNMFGGCPPGDPGCGGGMVPPGGGGGGSFMEPTSLIVTSGLGVDLDSPADGVKDINITFGISAPVNLSLPGDLTIHNNKTQNLSLGKIVYCGGGTCDGSAVAVTTWFEGFSCSGALNSTDGNYKNHSLNFTGATLACLQTSKNTTYKIAMLSGANAPTNVTIQYLQDTGGVGGSTALNVSSNSGISYFNATLKSIRVGRFDFSTGETVLTHGTDYNVTSANGVLVGAGNINIPGTGGIKLKPYGTWTSGFYHVVAEFNTSEGSETAESGFLVETFTVSCFRPSWYALQSGDQLVVTCTVSNPSGGNYPNRVDISVESVKDSFTGSSISAGQSTWATINNFTDASAGTAIIAMNQSLSTGFYEAVVKLNASTDTKRTSVWFDVRDFDPTFYSDRWSYSSGDNITFIAYGTSGATRFRVNISGSPTVYRYDRTTWSRETVSGVTAISQVDRNASWNINVTVINLSRSGGWAEGQYNVLLNLTRINGTNAATGGVAGVSTWFDVRLFDVWGYTTQWTYHPKSNVTINVFVGNPSAFNSRYASSVDVNITDIRDTTTGTLLTKGTHYSVVDNTTTPSVSGDVVVKIIPISSLPSGSYKAKISVKDSVSGNIVTTDVYFNVVAFYASTYAETYDVAAGDNSVHVVYVYSPSGSAVTLSNGTITSLSFCSLSGSSCSSKALSSFNYTFNTATLRLVINTTGFSSGTYTGTFVVNDTQNINASAYISFRVTSVAINGYVPYPTGVRSGYGYQINETMQLNVTGTLGVNITNATFSYWDCTSSGCTYKLFVVQIGYNMTARNVLLNLTPANITPATLNNTWLVNEYAGYSIEVKGVKDGNVGSFFTYASVYFPRATVSGPGSVSVSGGIGANITVYVEPLTSQNLSGANITVSDVLQDAGFSLTPLATGRWNLSSKIANSSGAAELIVQLNGTNWPSGTLRVRYNIVYGNATTKAEFTTSTSSPSLGLTKTLTNRTGAVITNASIGTEFNLSITLQNTQATDANSTLVTVTPPVHTTNTSAVIANLTALSFLTNVTNSNIATLNFQFNATAGRGNYTTQISITPPSPFTSAITSHTFKVG